MYKLIKNLFNNESNQVKRLLDGALIPFDLANTDYQQFKKDLQSGSTLIDSDNNTMSEEQIKIF
jgi:hypothetical protein